MARELVKFQQFPGALCRIAAFQLQKDGAPMVLKAAAEGTAGSAQAWGMADYVTSHSCGHICSSLWFVMVGLQDWPW